MQDQSLKLRAIPNHFHREDQIVCERCMSQIASSGSPLVDGFHEYVYVTGQLIGLLIDSGVRLLVALARSVKFGLNRVGSIHASQTKKNVKDHVHENGQQVCEKCLTGFTSTGSTIIDHIGEYFHMAHEVMLLFAQFILIAGLGIGMVITALFPTLAGRRSPREESLNQQARERRQQRWEERQREIEERKAYDKERDDWFNSNHAKLRADKQRYAQWSNQLDQQFGAGKEETHSQKQKRSQFNDTREEEWRNKVKKSRALSDKVDKEWKDKIAEAHKYDEELDREWRRRVEEDNERYEKECDEYERNCAKINSVDLSHGVFIRADELLEDDLIVKDVNNTLRGVESGVEDPERLRIISEELLRFREESAARDARRQQLYSNYRDRYWEAGKLHRDAIDAFNREEFAKGEGLIRAAEAADADANRIYNQFLSV